MFTSCTRRNSERTRNCQRIKRLRPQIFDYTDSIACGGSNHPIAFPGTYHSPATRHRCYGYGYESHFDRYPSGCGTSASAHAATGSTHAATG